MTKHWSDCAVHSEPAYPAGECDCGGFKQYQDEGMCQACEFGQCTAKAGCVATSNPSPKQEHGEQDNYQGSDAAKAAHMMDLYTALGVRWGDDPFAVIAKMRDQQPKQEQGEPLCTAAMFDDAFLAKSGLSPDTKLYTTPQQRKPLTDEQADSIINGLRTCLHRDSMRQFLKVWLRDWAAHGAKDKA
jgi:hypothetical protein